MSRFKILGLVVLLLLTGAFALWYRWNIDHNRPTHDANRPAEGSSPFHFTDIASQAGVSFTYFRGETGKFWLTETTGGGVALVDFDADGWLDILVANGCRQPPDPADREHTSHLFRNQRDGTFVEATVASGVVHAGYGQGCFAFDYDNDGFDDLYLTSWGPNALYRNNGDGTFSLPPQPGQPATDLWSTGAVPGDFDRDGDLDLLVVNYVLFDHENQPRCGDPRTGVVSYCGPDSFPPTPSVMLSNRGDGSFEDVSRDSGIVLPDGSARPHAKGLGAVAADLDDDGSLDIYVANDLEPNFLFLNRPTEPGGGIHFDEVALAKGAATNGDGAAQDSMGVACGDYDGDRRLDLLVTNFYLEGVTLYKNLGALGFADATRATGLLGPTRNVLGWGTGLFDFDNDGWLDLFAANGHVQPEPDPGVSYAMPAQLFRNTSGARFDEVTNWGGDYSRGKWNGRGAAFGDIDNDGDVDIVVVHHHQPLAILRNDTKSQNHWLQIELVGSVSDRNAVGTRVIAELETDKTAEPARRLMRVVNPAGSYLSSSDRRILLGLGPGSRIDRLEVRWLCGAVQELHDVPTGEKLILTEPVPVSSSKSGS